MLCFSILNAINSVDDDDDDGSCRRTSSAGCQIKPETVEDTLNGLLLSGGLPVQTMTAIIMGLETSLENDQLSRDARQRRVRGTGLDTFARYYLSLVLLA